MGVFETSHASLGKVAPDVGPLPDESLYRNELQDERDIQLFVGAGTWHTWTGERNRFQPQSRRRMSNYSVCRAEF